MNQSAAAVSSEQIVDRDREFDQTAKTDTAAADFARPMPAVIEQHNARQRSEQTFSRDSITIRELTNKLAAAELRIQQFEKFAQNLAEKIDEINADCIFLTGKSFDEHLADLNRERGKLRETGAASSLCREDLGGGMVCLRHTGHDGLCNANPQPPHVEELDVTKPCPTRNCQLVNGHRGDHMF